MMPILIRETAASLIPFTTYSITTELYCYINLYAVVMHWLTCHPKKRQKR